MTMRAFVLTGLLCILALPGAAQDVEKGGDFVTIKIDKELELRDFLDQVGKATQKPIIYDPNGQRIRGQKMGVSFVTRVPKERAFDNFRALLAYYELMLVPVGPKGYESYLVVDSRSTNNFIKNRAIWIDAADIEQYADRDGLYIACVFTLPNLRNKTMVRTSVSTMVSPAGIGRVTEYAGGILVMDFAPSVVAIGRILRTMDKQAEATAPVMEVVELKHARARDLASTLSALMAEPVEEHKLLAQKRASGLEPMKPRIVSYDPRNAVVVYAAKMDAARLRQLIAELDVPPTK